MSLPFCPTARRTRIVSGVPLGGHRERVAWVAKHGVPYGTKRWLEGRARVIAALDGAGVHLDLVSLGCGSFGCAYPVQGQPEVAVKITGDPSEAAAAAAVIAARQRGHSFPALVTFHCAYSVRGSGLFVLIQERLERLDARERMFLTERSAELIAAVSYPERTRALSARTLARLGSVDAVQVEALVTTMVALRAAGIGWADLHTGNVLADPRSGAWKIIDLGVSTVPPQAVPQLGWPRGWG